MTELASISKLLEDRVVGFAKITNEIFLKISDRLTLVFQKLSDNPDRRMIWTSIEPIDGTDKAVFISGLMSLHVGETIIVGDNTITLDETNVNQYNRVIKFAFPIIMLELATVDELAEHVNRMTKMGNAMDMTNLPKILDNIAIAYQESILNDPTKVKIMDAITKPNSIMGFAVTDLTDSQIYHLKILENSEYSGKMN